jgi:hypothetical protein
MSLPSRFRPFRGAVVALAALLVIAGAAFASQGGVRLGATPLADEQASPTTAVQPTAMAEPSETAEPSHAPDPSQVSEPSETAEASAQAEATRASEASEGEQESQRPDATGSPFARAERAGVELRIARAERQPGWNRRWRRPRLTTTGTSHGPHGGGSVARSRCG